MRRKKKEERRQSRDERRKEKEERREKKEEKREREKERKLCFALLCFCFAFVLLCFALLCVALLCFALLCVALCAWGTNPEGLRGTRNPGMPAGEPGHLPGNPAQSGQITNGPLIPIANSSKDPYRQSLIGEKAYEKDVKYIKM